MNTHTSRRITQTLGALLAAAFLPLAATAQGLNQPGETGSSLSGSDPQAELAQLQQEFIAVKTQLETAQQQALQRDSVKQAVDDAEKALKTAMLEEAPQQSEPIEEYFEIRAQLAELEEVTDQAQAEQLVNEFTQLSNELNPLLEQANLDQEVQQAREESRETILAAMQEIEPETPQLLERQRQLMARYQQLRQQSSGQGG